MQAHNATISAASSVRTIISEINSDVPYYAIVFDRWLRGKLSAIQSTYIRWVGRDQAWDLVKEKKYNVMVLTTMKRMIQGPDSKGKTKK